MIIALVLLTIVVFIVVDVLLRTVIRKIQEKKTLKEREEALDLGLKLDFAEEAKSLKKVRVENPKAKILAVDDEAIILDSFRKILVIAGYSVDTVETGKELLGLIRDNDYDFVFTDLKMPEMDGLDVVKAVKHLRPDIDVIMITGYATIETAVDAMKFGALDYVQKPFTADELINFVNKSLIVREDRIERQIRPTVHLITPSIGASKSPHEFNVPTGVFISPGHTWVKIYPNGMLLVGLDDFVQKLVGPVDGVELPSLGEPVKKGDPLFAIRQGSHALTFNAPVSGKVASINRDIAGVPDLINRKPFESGWVCGIEPSSLPDDLQTLRIGADATAWYQEEIDRYYELLEERRGKDEDDSTGEDGEQDPEIAEALKWEVLTILDYARVDLTS